MSFHYHSCPECYTHHLCDMDCTIEPDLQDGEKEFGSHCLCQLCEDVTTSIKKYDTRWFAKYNGFIG